MPATFLFVSEYLRLEYGNVSVITHLVDTGKDTQAGNRAYKLHIYDEWGRKKVGEANAYRMISKKNKPYFKVLIRDDDSDEE